MKAQTLAMLAVVVGAHDAQARDMRFVTEPFPPYTYASDGRAAGPMVDVLLTACARLAWRCDIEVLPWRRALGMAQRGEVEGIFTVVDSPERRQYFHVSPPVIEGRYMLFARAGNGLQYTGDAQVLAGRTIGAYGPSATALTLEALVENVPRVRTEIEPDNRRAQDAIKKLFIEQKSWDDLEQFYAKQNKYDELIRVFERQVETEDDANKVILWNRIAVLYRDKMDKADRAMRAFEKVLALDARNLQAAEALIPLYEQATGHKVVTARGASPSPRSCCSRSGFGCTARRRPISGSAIFARRCRGRSRAGRAGSCSGWRSS